MSGIELAGLVLGAFPLLLASMEKYRESAELLSDWWRIQRAYRKCKQDIEYHRILFETNLEEFLLPLVVDEDELGVLMANPAGELWENQELEERLQDRLPKSYNLYLDTIGEINQLMERLKKELGVKNALLQRHLEAGKYENNTGMGKLKTSRMDLLSMSNFEYQTQRIKFSLKKTSREKTFRQLQDYNDRMRKLLESSDRTSALRRTKGIGVAKPAMNTKLGDFWSHAKRLHHALSNAWRCSCTGHLTALQLQHRTTPEIEFNIVFHNKREIANIPIRWDCRETRIKLLRNEELNQSITSNVIETVPAITSQINHRKTETMSPRSAVKLKSILSKDAPLTNPSVTSYPPRVSWANTKSIPLDAPEHNRAKITDLCASLAKPPETTFGFVEEEDDRFIVYPQPVNDNPFNTNLTTLDAVLKEPSKALTRLQRYSIALTLASSYLQLSSTPWLTAPFGKGDIMFQLDNENTKTILAQKPFIYQDFTGHLPRDTDRALSTLGIRLLELCFGTALECHNIRLQLPPGDMHSAPMLDYAAALQWARMVGEEAGPEFSEVVDWCLRGDVSGNESWRREIIKHVIDPLEYCYNQVSLGRTAV